MKKIFSLLVVALATMTLSAQTYQVTWNLDGGCANPMCATNKAELFNAFMTDAGATDFETLEYYMAQTDPLSAPNICAKLANAAPALVMPQWAWLKAYIEAAHTAQTADGASSLPADGTGAAWRYAVGAFFCSTQRASWPKSADFTELGKDAAYTPSMNAAGQYYAYPAEVAADFVLPTPIKAGYTFLGWYNGENKVETISADATLTAKWDVSKFNVTWNLDGGCANPMCATNKAELFNAFMTDAGATDFETLEYYMAQTDPLSAPNICAKLANAAPALVMPQWAWLKAYIEAAHTAQTADGASSLPADGTGAAWRYAVGAFFCSTQRASWPKSADFTELGKDAAYTPSMNAAGIYYELPAQYTMVQELPVPFKAEYNFLGWYNGDTKVEHVDADMALTAKWERAIYNVAFVAPFAYPNDMYVDDVYELAYALQKDYNAAYNASKAWAKMEDGQVYFHIGEEWKLPAAAQGNTADVANFIQAVTYNTADNLKNIVETTDSKWAWLKPAIETSRTASELSGEISENLYRKEISGMFLASPKHTGWPASSDWTKYNADSIRKAWGGIVALPDTIESDYTLPAMYRENYEFKGWYWNADFTGDPVTVVPVKSNGTLYAKFEATDKALLAIALNKKDTVELQMPNTDQLTVTFTPETAANKKVVWSSSNEEVLVVDQNGLVTPKAPGLATVKVVSDESKLEASVVYNISAAPGAVTGVTLDQTNVTLEMGKTIQLIATIAPEDATNKKVTWTSDSKAASVDENGLVKADTVGTATITVTTEDGGYTATCVVTVPEPLDDILVEKLWEVAIPTAVANIGDVRNGMGWNGKFYLTDKNQNKVRVFTKEGEDVDAAIAMPEGAKLGTGIAIDDAGNILLAANFPGNDTCVFIVKNGEKTMKKVDFNLPIPGRADQFTAFGNVSSEQGGLVFFHGTGATKIQYVKIANDTLVEVKQMEPIVNTGSSTANVLYGTETEAWLNVRGQGMQYIKDGVVTSVAPKNVITNDCGGAIMFIGENEVWAYKVGTVHSSEFSIRNMTTQQFVADKDGNTVQYFIDKAAAANNSYANFTKAEKINDYAYYLNVFTSGKGAAVYKVYKDVPATAIALDKTAETVKAGDKLQLTATITPSYATIQEVVWSTSDSAIAIVDQMGLVQAIGAGEATITVATTDGTNLTATCALTVEPVLYRKAMSVQELEAGKKMLITNGDSLVMAAHRGNNFGAVAVTVEDGVINNVPAEATVITLEKDSVFGFAIDGGYITATTAASNYLKIAAERSSLTEWDITVAEDGVAGIVCHDTVAAERNTIRFNENRGTPIFSAYRQVNTQEDVNIYIEFEPVTYNVTVPEGTPACYIAGEMNSWTFTEMTKVDATHYTITLNYANKAHKYKYTCGPDWKYVEKNADGSERADRTWTEADVVEKWADLEEAVNNIQVDTTTVQKVMIDGHLYILHNNKIYDVLGATVR